MILVSWLLNIGETMNVEFKYDKATTELLNKWDEILVEYTKLLMNRYKHSPISEIEAQRMLSVDSGRDKILEQITRIREASMPVGVDFVGVTQVIESDNFKGKGWRLSDDCPGVVIHTDI